MTLTAARRRVHLRSWILQQLPLLNTRPSGISHGDDEVVRSFERARFVKAVQGGTQIRNEI